MVNVVDAAERLGSAIDGCVLPDGDSKCAIVSKALPRITLIQVGDVVNLSIEQRAFSDVICDDIEDTEAAATRPRTADEAHEVEHWVKRLEGKRS